MGQIFIGNFPLGQVVATPGLLENVGEDDRISAITRHHNSDWGEVSAEDAQSNDEALKDGERLLSAYETADAVRFWIITEYDRSVTTLLLPEEY